MSPEHQSLNVSCLCVAVCWVCVSVWSWSALQFALQDLKIALANTPRVHPLFVLYCIVYYKRERECVCVTVGGICGAWSDDFEALGVLLDQCQEATCVCRHTWQRNVCV